MALATLTASLSWSDALKLAAREAAGEPLADAMTELAARGSEHHLWQVRGENVSDGSLRSQMCLWPDEAAMVAAYWRELSLEKWTSETLRPMARQVRVESINLAAALDSDPEALKEMLVPLSKALAHLPPYTDDEVAANAREWKPLVQIPERVWARVRFVDIPLLLAKGVTGTYQVRFPLAWPANPEGRGKWYVPWSYIDWREHRRLGDAARPHNWAIPVRSVSSDGAICWGMIDIEGQFVLPCEYGYLGSPECWRIGNAPLLPAGRRDPWLWVEARKAPLELPESLDTAAEPINLPRSRVSCDVIEVWSGMRINPPGLWAVPTTLTSGSFLVRSEVESATPLLGRMQAGQESPGPLVWRRIVQSIADDLSPAQDASSGLWGYIDGRGATVIAPQFASARCFNSGIAQVKVALAADDVSWGVIDESGEWVLEPRWRGIEDEYDGHFMVQATDGSWGVVTPEGQIVVPFFQTHITGAIGLWLKTRFKQVQQQRYRHWLKVARVAGSLAVFAGKLHSSYGAYDHGALTTDELPIKVIRRINVTGQYYAPENSGPRQATLAPGMTGKWRPGARHYAHFVDLRRQAVVEIDGLDVHRLQVPWNALALLPAPPADFKDPVLAARFAHLQSSAHREALDAAIEAFEDAIDKALPEVLADRETPSSANNVGRQWSARFVEPPDENPSIACRSLRDALMDLRSLDICLDDPNEKFFHYVLERIERLCQNTIQVDSNPAIETAWTSWIRAYRS